MLEKVKKKIGDTEYTIIPIPPHLSPYNSRISELLQKKTQNLQETKETSQELEECMKILLSGTVKPQPLPEDQTEVYNALIDLTNEVISKAQFFRKNQGPSPAKSSSICPTDSQKTK